MRHAEKVPSYAIAVLSVALALVLKWMGDPVGERDYNPFVFFAAAVTLTAWYGGLGPGLLALSMSIAVSTLLLLPPMANLWIDSPEVQYRVLAFTFEGLVICSVCEALHRARQRAELATEEARQALRGQRSSEARFRRLAESDVIGVIAGRDQAIIEANHAFLRMLGQGPDRLAVGSLPVSEITPEPFRSQDEGHWSELFRTGTLSPIEKEYLTEDGRRVPVLVGGALVEPGSSDWVAFVLDLSRQKRVERELAEAIARAEAASRSKSEFLAVLSHELITPMNAILGMNQLVLGSESDPKLRDYLVTAQESAEALLTLLSDLLDYSSIEVGGFELDPAPFRLRAVVDQAVRPLSTRASRKGLELTGSVADEVPDDLIGDARRLRQVLVNLLDNAIKFTRAGKVTLTVGLGSEGNGNDLGELALRFEVADTGIGIAAEDRDRIFSPFTQLDASSTRPYSGTGLGLSICRQIIGLMEGEMMLVSRPGQGSRFAFTARFRRQPAGSLGPPDRSPGLDLRGLRVLVADAEPGGRRLIESTLLGWSMRPVLVTDGRAALGALGEAARRNTPFPLAILDARLPEQDSIALAERIRREGLAGATILVRSPGDSTAIVESIRRSRGVSATLERPVTASKLLDAIRAAFEPPSRTPTVPTARRPASRSLQILLAEDTPANQKLALAVLRRRGHRVDLAANGREAVELAGRRRYDLVLMDVQMPVMDGLQATAAIRSFRDGPGPEVPIVALTAHAMRGDQERCLSAGMDGYIAKPIDIDSFLNVVEAFAPRPGDESPDGPSQAPSTTNAPTAADDRSTASGGHEEQNVGDDPGRLYNRAAALKRLGHDEDLFRDMIFYFLEDFPRLLDQLRTGLLNDDAQGVERSAHSLKALAANCGSGPAAEAASIVEDLGRERRLSQAPEAVERLVAELQLLRDALDADRNRR
jgi:PAS domain S-box-containing protein